ncbi:MAG: ABC transporter ATP-binding protein [Akkermansiaceae bacterium]
MSSDQPLVTLDSASKSFGTLNVLNQVNLTIPAGQLVVVLGSNGAGKTTLLRMIAGLLGLDSGKLKIAGERLNRLSEKQREKIFYLPDFPALFEEMTVLENLEIWLTLYGREQDHAEQELFALLERFNLAEKARLPMLSLSRGQRFKVALSCYEGSQAPIALLDEPFASGMDASGLKEMRTLLRKATADGRSVIYTTQLVSYALNFSDRILLIHDQGIYFDGTPARFQQLLDEADPVLKYFSEDEE